MSEGLTKADLAALVIWRAQPPKPMRIGRTTWTAEDMRDLRLMIAEGKTSGCIAQRLGRSRNSVCGKIYRMGGRGASE